MLALALQLSLYFCFGSITNVTLSDSFIDYIDQVKGVLKGR